MRQLLQPRADTLTHAELPHQAPPRSPSPSYGAEHNTFANAELAGFNEGLLIFAPKRMVRRATNFLRCSRAEGVRCGNSGAAVRCRNGAAKLVRYNRATSVVGANRGAGLVRGNGGCDVVGANPTRELASRNRWAGVESGKRGAGLA